MQYLHVRKLSAPPIPASAELAEVRFLDTHQSEEMHIFKKKAEKSFILLIYINMH